jgi:hypothetical protein
MPPDNVKGLENVQLFIKNDDGSYTKINKEPINIKVEIKRDSVK